jgi:hypothetical protein
VATPIKVAANRKLVDMAAMTDVEPKIAVDSLMLVLSANVALALPVSATSSGDVTDNVEEVVAAAAGALASRTSVNNAADAVATPVN